MKKSNLQERKKNVDIALAINSLDSVEPSEDCKELLDEYTKGTIEAKDITKKLIEKYKVKEI